MIEPEAFMSLVKDYADKRVNLWAMDPHEDVQEFDKAIIELNDAVEEIYNIYAEYYDKYYASCYFGH